MAQPVLAYGIKRPRRSRRRLTWLAVVLVMASTSAWLFRPKLRELVERVRFRRTIHQCETYRLPPDAVVFENDPQLTGGYANNPAFVRATSDRPDVIRLVPPLAEFGRRFELHYWLHYWDWNGALFCHSRTSKAGHRRLVVIHGFLDGRFSVTVLDTGSFSAPPMVVRSTSWSPRQWAVYRVLRGSRHLFGGARHGPGAVTLYAGQPDPTDLSHLTIKYVGGGGSGTIDGWLLDSDIVRFRALDGPYGSPLSYFTDMEEEETL